MYIYSIEETAEMLESIRAQLDRLESTCRPFNSYEMNRLTSALLTLRELGSWTEKAK